MRTAMSTFSRHFGPRRNPDVNPDATPKVYMRNPMSTQAQPCDLACKRKI